jgi:cytochrome c
LELTNRKITIMKKSFLILATVLALACNNASDKSSAKTGSDSNSNATAGATEDAVPPGLTKDEYDKAISLIASSDCLTCHKVDEKVTGPSYREVSQKYEATDANIEMLANKVKKGGSGVWGQAMMTPHDTLSLDDAKVMVKYILALKNTK